MRPDGEQHHEERSGSSARLTADPRAARTRQMIFGAVETLMSERTSTVSVSDIVRTAGISRSSFYAHFTGLDILATDYLRSQLAEISQAGVELRRKDLITGMPAARIGYRRLIAHMVEHYPLYSSVLELPPTRTAHNAIVGAYAGQIVQSIEALDFVPAGVDPELVATYVAGGALTLIGAWMNGQFEASDDALVEQLASLFPTWLIEPPA
jgi:AcrR family transcriptional regulator